MQSHTVDNGSMELIRYGQEVRTIFDLFGSKENDMTFSLGWVLSRSGAFLRLLIADVCGSVPSHLRNAIIKLQTGRGMDGITDIEIEVSSELVFVIEAKRGPQLPTARQLAKYANFLSGSAAKNKHLLALTNASAASAGNMHDPRPSTPHVSQPRILSRSLLAPTHLSALWWQSLCFGCHSSDVTSRNGTWAAVWMRP